MYQNEKIAAAIRAVLVAAPGIAGLNSAQAEPAQPAPSELQEVTVYGQAETYRPKDQTTATGLNMKLIDTPQSISVVSDEMLKMFNVQSAYDAVDMIPGASQGGNGFGAEHVLIRGQPLTEPRVNGMNALTFQYLDSYALERIEVVRGPATVLYGITGGFGGELNQILKKPTDSFHANFGYNNGSFSHRRYEGDVSGPIPGTDDRLKVRVVGAYTNYGIPQATIVDPNDISKFASLAATYDFSTATTASLSAYKEVKSLDATDGCPLAQNSNKQLYIPTSIPVEHWYCNDPRQSKSAQTNALELAELRHTLPNDWTVDAKVAHSKGTVDLNYVFGVGPAGSGGLAPTDVYLYGYDTRSQAVTLTSNLSLGGKFDMLGHTHQFFAAVEYQREEQNQYNATSFGLGTMNMFRDGGLGISSNGTPIPSLPPTHWVSHSLSRFKNLIGSIQMLLNPVSRLNVLAGVLVQKADLSADVFKYFAPSTFSGHTETLTIPRLAVTYGLVADKGQWLTDAKAYFSYSEGYLPNIGKLDAAGNALTAPERMKSYEVGLKTTWLDGNFDVTVDVYDSYATNFPTNIFTIGTAGGTFSTVLGDRNTYRGGEVEMLGEVLPGWNVGLNYSYISAQQHSLLFSQKLGVANVPKQQSSLHTSYEFLKGPLKGLIFGGAIVWKDQVPLVDNAPALFSGKYDPNNQVTWSATRFDFRASYKDFAGHVKGLELYANVYNAFNSRSFFSLEGNPGFSNTVGSPRAVTAGVRYGF